LRGVALAGHLNRQAFAGCVQGVCALMFAGNRRSAVKIKVPVAQLERGMYVAELDRPWLGTPFLFQGFVIDDDDDLAQLRSLCQFVFVDDLQSSSESLVQRRLRDVAGQVSSGRVARITVEFEEWDGLARLRSTLERLQDKRGRVVDRLRKLAENPDNVSAEAIR